MATAAEWATRIVEIESAIHALMTGSRVVNLTSPDGTEVDYQPTDLDKLQRYYDWAIAQQQKASGAVRGPVYISPK